MDVTPRETSLASALAVALISMLILSLTGCVNYRAIGAAVDGSLAMHGNVQGNLMDGTAKIHLTDIENELACKGSSVTTHMNLSFNCGGQKGRATLDCSDGRRMVGDWIASTCTSGVGVGRDSKGNTFNFMYGMNDKEAAQKLSEMLGEVSITDRELLEENISAFSSHIVRRHSEQINKDLADAIVIGTVLFIGVELAKNNGYQSKGFSSRQLFSNPAFSKSLSSMSSPCGVKPVTMPGYDKTSCMDGKWRMTAGDATGYSLCGVKPAGAAGYQVGDCVNGKWQLVSDSGLEISNCGVKPMVQSGYSDAACVSGAWRMVYR